MPHSPRATDDATTFLPLFFPKLKFVHQCVCPPSHPNCIGHWNRNPQSVANFFGSDQLESGAVGWFHRLLRTAAQLREGTVRQVVRNDQIKRHSAAAIAPYTVKCSGSCLMLSNLSGCDRKRTDGPFSTERTVRSLSITTTLVISRNLTPTKLEWLKGVMKGHASAHLIGLLIASLRRPTGARGRRRPWQ